MDLRKLRKLHKELFVVKTMLANTNGVDKYSFAPCFVGKDYFKCEKKLMIVGQNSNGWDRDDGMFNNADQYAEYIIDKYFNPKSKIYDGFQWIEDAIDRRDSYFLQDHSGFWKFGRMVFERFSGVPHSTYKPTEVWQHSIVQSDTMKITNHDRKIGNICDESDGQFLCERTVQIDLCLQILLKEIELLKPTHVLFMTNVGDYFFDALNVMFEPVPDSIGLNTNKIVKSTGMIGDSKCFVTIHPQGLREKGKQTDLYLDALDSVNKFKGWDLF